MMHTSPWSEQPDFFFLTRQLGEDGNPEPNKQSRFLGEGEGKFMYALFVSSLCYFHVCVEMDALILLCVCCVCVEERG